MRVGTIGKGEWRRYLSTPRGERKGSEEKRGHSRTNPSGGTNPSTEYFIHREGEREERVVFVAQNGGGKKFLVLLAFLVSSLRELRTPPGSGHIPQEQALGTKKKKKEKTYHTL